MYPLVFACLLWKNVYSDPLPIFFIGVFFLCIIGVLYVLDIKPLSDKWFADVFFFLRFHLFLERGEGRGREGEKHQCMVAFHVLPTGDLARSPGLCPDWESNERPFASQSGAQSAEPRQPGLQIFSYILMVSFAVQKLFSLI